MHIEEVLLLAKGARGKSLCDLIVKATSDPGIYEFGELVELPAAKELGSSAETKPFAALLHLFAYGTWSDYKSAAPGTYQPLSESQAYKLKQLSVVSFAKASHELEYDSILQALEIPDVRSLEDFFIDCMYSGLLKGKLDQQRRLVHVTDSAGRDVSPEELTRLRGVLAGWLEYSQEIMRMLDTRSLALAEAADEQKKARAAVQQKIEEEKARLRQEQDRGHPELPHMAMEEVGYGRAGDGDGDEDMEIFGNVERGGAFGGHPRGPGASMGPGGARTSKRRR